jgi:hypothetical protein
MATTDPSADVLRWVSDRLRWERFLAATEAEAAAAATDGPSAGNAGSAAQAA